MRGLLATLGTIMIVIGLGGAAIAFTQMYLSEGDSSYDNSVTCTTTSDNNTVCRFTDQPSNVNAEFGLMTVMAIGGGSLMVTGGALVAGACALSTRGSRKERQQAPAYAGAQAGYGGPPVS